MAYGNSFVFGIKDPLPLRGFSEGRVRIRMRHSEFAKAFIRPPEGGIRMFVVKSFGGVWRPGPEQSANRIQESTNDP